MFLLNILSCDVEQKMISSNLREVASFSFSHEAHIAKARLDAADIPVFITDEHTINMQWLYSGALGGVRLLVPFAYEKNARDLLAIDFSESLKEEMEVDELKCPCCSSTNVEPYTIGKRPAFVVFLLLGFPLFFYNHGMKCNNCGEISKT